MISPSEKYIKFLTDNHPDIITAKMTEIRRLQDHEIYQVIKDEGQERFDYEWVITKEEGNNTDKFKTI